MDSGAQPKHKHKPTKHFVISKKAAKWISKEVFSHNADLAIKNLRKMIVDSGMSSEKVAFGAGIHKATISKYLSRKREPKISVLEKIAEYLKQDFINFFR